MANLSIAEVRSLAEETRAAWATIHREGATDMRYVAGDPWDPHERKARADAGRPALALDELNQYFNQIVNEVRANPRAIIVTPAGPGASEDTARIYQELIREIEYRSKAPVAYAMAFQNAIERGYGYVRVTTRWDDDASFNQSLWIEAVPNPDAVLLDPSLVLPDGSDATYAFVFSEMPTTTFQQRFPGASLDGWDDVAERAWRTERTIRVAEYWYREETRQRVLAVQTPSGLQVMPASAYDPASGWVVERERDVLVPTVSQCVLNGHEILSTTEWAGRYIPIVACFGKIIYVDRGQGPERYILSMTRLARDPYMLYCYYRTCEAELVGMTPKFPYFVYDGQLAPDELVKLQRSLHEPVAAIKVRPVVDALPASLLPVPKRQTYDPPIVALEAGAESARRAIQAAMGTMPMPTAMQGISQKSGVALRRIEATTQKGAFHFLDHYELMVQQVGIVLEDLIDKIYDTARDIVVRSLRDETRVVRVNDPQAPGSVSLAGRHAVTISAGPSFASEREAASAFADQLASNPEIFRLIGPMVVRLKQLGPIGDEIAKALEYLQPPELRAGAGVADPTAMRLLRQAQTMIEGLSRRVQELQQAIDADLVHELGETQRQQMRIRSQQALEGMRGELQLLLQTLRGSQTQQQAAFEAIAERARQRETMAHEAAIEGLGLSASPAAPSSSSPAMPLTPSTQTGTV